MKFRSFLFASFLANAKATQCLSCGATYIESVGIVEGTMECFEGSLPGEIYDREENCYTEKTVYKDDKSGKGNSFYYFKFSFHNKILKYIKKNLNLKLTTLREVEVLVIGLK